LELFGETKNCGVEFFLFKEGKILKEICKALFKRMFKFILFYFKKDNGCKISNIYSFFKNYISSLYLFNLFLFLLYLLFVSYLRLIYYISRIIFKAKTFVWHNQNLSRNIIQFPQCNSNINITNMKIRLRPTNSLSWFWS